MSLNTDLVTRVRSNINESSSVQSPRRTDAEILRWLQDAQLDYVHRIPKEQLPEIQASVTFSGESVSLPADYLFYYACRVNHTISGTYTEIVDCFVINPGEDYFRDHYPSLMGAWAQIVDEALQVGPNVISGTLSYIQTPTDISTTNSVTVSLGVEHESAIVNYATAMALLKVNDDDSDNYMSLYEGSIASKGGEAREAKEIERA